MAVFDATALIHLLEREAGLGQRSSSIGKSSQSLGSKKKPPSTPTTPVWHPLAQHSG